MKNTTELFRRDLEPPTGMTVTIAYTSDGILSFGGSGKYGYGQTYEYLTEGTPKDGYTRGDCLRLKQVWKRWHCNDMRAGTPRQEEAVREWHKTVDNPRYEETCEMLEKINMP